MTQRIASLVAQLVPGEKAVRLLPAGEFRAADGSGRPKDAPAWRIDADLAARLIARVNARASRRVVDYEHQTIAAAHNGQPAPAAGWIEHVDWRDGVDGKPGGLYATIAWTEKAAAMIAAGEYRYISPVFPYDAEGRVLDILHAGLTNNPGLDGLTDLAALSSAFPDQETPPMKDLLKALGLADSATEAEALAAVASLKAKADDGATQVAALTAEVTTLKATAPDPAKYVPVETVTQLQGQVAALTAQMAGREVDELVQAGLADGRILPAMEGWARELGKKGVAELKAYLEHASPIAALKGTQTGGAKPAGGDGPADEEAAKASYKSSAALKAEFPTEADYIGFWKADRAGQIKNLTGKE